MSARRFFRPLGLALLGTLTLVACGSDIGNDTGDQKDTFRNPTEHGGLVFTGNARNEGNFTASARFHSWTFTLTDDAEIVLQTDPYAVNLDTVLYLYRRDSADENWGSYIKKNDNHGDEMYSRIEKSLTAGEYRIKVRATHHRMVGDFNVEASCDGAGCPVEEGGTCEPTYGGGTYTTGCGERIRNVMLAPVTSESSTTVTWGDHCDHPNLVAQAATAYRDYYGDWFDWDDYVGEDGEMYVTTRKHGDAGAVVGVDLGGDEDHVSFLFDENGKLLVLFHSEQSSSTWYTCGADGEEQVTEPDTEECGQALLHSLAHDSSDGSSGSTSAADAEGDLGTFLSRGVAYFATLNALGDTDSISYTASTWDEGAELELSAGGQSATLLLADRWGDSMLAMRTIDGYTEVMCENLE